ncbi:hypothetical protein Psi02_20850 [Planotetraspora silvatica]|uniref:Uncharacterized protein n=2 Tax=Planotetraspora silvatica TaxID=234614 RepID=A0A8J3ULW6_9ACTN|nr:hypothetical protein Psi02_20850 [Planotetraspora silvatica]
MSWPVGSLPGMNHEIVIETWRRLLDPAKSWVLFTHGTCVILMEPAGDLAQQATTILREYGPVHVGSPAGDFDVITLDDVPGWAVTGHHPDVLTYVAPDELEEHGHLHVGLLGRDKRDRDGREPAVVHVEDMRPS